MSSRILVSIGMPVYNCAETVDQAIRSILNQTTDDWQLIVIDDGSTDDTYERVISFDDPRIFCVRCNENRGLPTRLNECVGIARGKYFARMDGDDIAYPDRLKKQVEYLECHPQVDLLAAGCIVFRGQGEAYGLRRSTRLMSHSAASGNALSGPHLAHPTWMGRIEWFRRNPYRARFVGTEDRELLIRTRHVSTFAVLPDVLLGYREDRVLLRKVLPARFHLSRAYLEDALIRGHLLYGLGGIAFQFLKSGLDMIAIGTGLRHRLLRHRATPLPDDARQEWEAVWQSALGQPCRESKYGG
jgi:glycosyltransferase involved in cell wall biosynthesis